MNLFTIKYLIKFNLIKKISKHRCKIFRKIMNIIIAILINSRWCIFKNFIFQPTFLLKKFGQSSIEPEIALRVKEDINISHAPFSIKDINNLFDGFVCSLEIVDFRFNKNLKEIGAYNLIATNGASEFWIRNSEVFSMNKINFDDHEVSISFNNQIVGEGNVNKVMENPLNSALWLINKISGKGEPLLKGQFISTGTCTKAHELKQNIKVSANFGELGKIEFNYN